MLPRELETRELLYLSIHGEKLVHAVEFRGCCEGRWRDFATFNVRINRHRLRVIQSDALTFHEFLYTVND